MKNQNSEIQYSNISSNTQSNNSIASTNLISNKTEKPIFQLAELSPRERG